MTKNLTVLFCTFLCASAAVTWAEDSGHSPPRLVEMIQDRLETLGWGPGPERGFLDLTTVAAIRAYQRFVSLPETGQPTIELLEELASECRIRVRTGSRGDTMIPQGGCKKPEETSTPGVFVIDLGGGSSPPTKDERPSLRLEDPRIATRAPKDRDLPDYLFDTEDVAIPKGRWGNRTAIQGTRWILDADRDGKPDMVRYIDNRGTFIGKEEDRDLDGEIDTWSTFLGGDLIKRDLDTNGDGAADVWERYADGHLISREVDQDHEGKPTAFFVFQNGVLVSERYDKTGRDQVEADAGHLERNAPGDRLTDTEFDTNTKGVGSDRRKDPASSDKTLESEIEAELRRQERFLETGGRNR